MNKDKATVIITTSWDDGDKADLKILSLLDKYNLKGTFYIPPLVSPLISSEIIQLGQTQEVGAHTLHHISLTEVSLDEAKKEISGSKRYLEDLLQKPVRMFCYPRGEYNQEVKELVRASGFQGARTTQRFCLGLSQDSFTMPTTINIHPSFLYKKKKRNFFRPSFLVGKIRENYWPFLVFKSRVGLSFKDIYHWQKIAQVAFDYVCQHGGIWHIWGHSQIIEQYQLWSAVERIFATVANQDNILYLTNSQILEMINKRKT